MFDAASFIAESAQKMKDEIDDIAIIACSGGVDSTVAAVIAIKPLVTNYTVCMLILD